MRIIEEWMIYGANGYTGRLIAAEAAKRGQKPILAGRNEQQIIELAEKLELPFQIFDLDQPYKIKTELEKVGLVLNCAGPFIRTSKALRTACLNSGTHYLDITGEMNILQESYDCHEQAVEQGVVIISGVGFDVVPTDVIAKKLKDQLPSATHLEMAFAGDSGVSPGTAKTMLLEMSELGKIRKDNQLVQVPLAYQCKTFSFSDMDRFCMSIPWGDLVTAYENTKIPNITIYTAVAKKQAKTMKRMNHIAWIFKSKLLQRFLAWMIEKKVAGPDQQCRDAGFIKLYGRAWNEDEAVEIKMDAPEGYTYTVLASLMFVESLLAHQIMPGAYTPTQALSIERIIMMDGVNFS